MRLRKFHIYSADLSPQFGTESGKIRPVVIIQTDLLNDVHPSTIVCPITSKVKIEATVLRIHLSHSETGLKYDSDIMVDQIRAIDNRRFLREIGRIPEKSKHKLLESLSTILLD